nr:unnamed protein product [Digitaria exilis]
MFFFNGEGSSLGRRRQLLTAALHAALFL